MPNGACPLDVLVEFFPQIIACDNERFVLVEMTVDSEPIRQMVAGGSSSSASCGFYLQCVKSAEEALNELRNSIASSDP